MERVFVAYKHTGENPEELQDFLELVRSSFTSLGIKVRCTFFDEAYIRREKLTARSIMDHAFEIIDDGCDTLFIVQASADKSEGMLMEAGYCRAKRIPIIVAVKKGIKNTYLPEMADETFSWSTPQGLARGIYKFVSSQQRADSFIG